MRPEMMSDVNGGSVMTYHVTDFPLNAILPDDLMSDRLPTVIGVPEPLLLQLWQAHTRLQYDAGEYLGEHQMQEEVVLKYFMPETWLHDPEAPLTSDNMRGAHVNSVYGPTGADLPYPSTPIDPLFPGGGSGQSGGGGASGYWDTPVNGKKIIVGGQPFFLPLPTPEIMGNADHILFGWGAEGGEGEGFVCQAWPGYQRIWEPLPIAKLLWLRDTYGIYEGDPGCSYDIDYTPTKNYTYLNQTWKITADRSRFSETLCGAAITSGCKMPYQGLHIDMHHGLMTDRLDWVIMAIIKSNPGQFPKFTRPYFTAMLCRHTSSGGGGMGFSAYRRQMYASWGGKGGFGYPLGKRVGAGPGAAFPPLIPSILTVGAGAAAVSAVFARLPQLLRGQE